MTSRSSIQPFISEISDPSIRGFTSSLWALCFSSGQALSILAASQLDDYGWRYVSAFFAILMLLCFLGLLWIHETPEWLLENRQFDRAIKSLEFYKVDPKLIVEEDKKRLNENGEPKSYKELVGFYRGKTEEIINALLEDNLHPQVASLDRTLKSKAEIAKGMMS